MHNKIALFISLFNTPINAIIVVINSLPHFLRGLEKDIV